MALVYDPRTGKMVDYGTGTAAQPINVGGALGRAYLGSLAAVPAVALDAARRGVTNLAGGDVNTLPGGQAFYSDQAFGAIDQGRSRRPTATLAALSVEGCAACLGFRRQRLLRPLSRRRLLYLAPRRQHRRLYHRRRPLPPSCRFRRST